MLSFEEVGERSRWIIKERKRRMTGGKVKEENRKGEVKTD